MKEEDRRFFHENGYVLIRQAVEDTELDPLRKEIDVKYPSFIVKTRKDPGKETTWEQFLEKFLSPTSKYDENGNLL